VKGLVSKKRRIIIAITFLISLGLDGNSAGVSKALKDWLLFCISCAVASS
jgi:hypothetical protein